MAMIRIVVKFRCNFSFIAVMKQQGYVVWPGQRKVAVELPLLREGNSGGPNLYSIPSFAGDGSELRINAEECGDLLGGKAQVVCGISGKMLQPFYLKQEVKEQQISFSVPNRMVTIGAESRSKRIIIEIHALYSEGLIAWIETKTEYKGPIYKLPKNLRRFRPGAEAAIQRARCALCRHTHYADLSGR